MFFRFLSLIFVGLIMCSCNTGPEPDKMINAVIAFDKSIQSDEEVDNIVDALIKRINKISRNYKVERIGNKNRINIQIATDYNAERIKNLITNQGKLGFYETYKTEEVMSFMIQVNSLLKKGEENENPLFDLIKSQGMQGGPIIFDVSEKDTASVNSYLSLKSAKSSLPSKGQFIKFLWGRKEKNSTELSLYALKLNKQNKAVLTGDVILMARQEYGYTSNPTVTIAMNDEGAKKWENLTRKAFEQRSQIAIVVNDVVYSAPGVASGPITGGRSEITGDFTIEEAQDFAAILESGQVPKMKVVSFNVEKLK